MKERTEHKNSDDPDQVQHRFFCFILSFIPIEKNGVLRVDSVNFGEKYFNTTGGGGGVLGSLMPT